MKNTKYYIKQALNKFRMPKYHRNHKKKASEILKSIESVKGPIDPSLISQSEEYAKDVFGWKGYTPWLCVYAAIAGKFKEGWIPDNYYGQIVIPKIKGNYGKISDYLGINSKLFTHEFFPDIAYRINGIFVSKDYEILHEKNIKNFLFQNTDTIVFKIDESYQGKGVFFFNESSFNLNRIKELGNGVFQPFIEQHRHFQDYTKNSVSTLRITSVIENDGCPAVRAAYLRIGQGSDTHVKSSSHVRVPINLNSGALDANGYLTNWLTTTFHPDSKIHFEGRIVPSFNKCLNAVTQLHNQIPFVGCIGWDMIIDTNDNVKIMEWNGIHNDIKFSEATQGPCFLNLGWEKLWKNQF